MELNATAVQVDAEPHKIEFAVTIEKAWKEACRMYLSESGLKEDSEEWRFVMETEHFSQIMDVLIETWANYNHPVGPATSESASSPQFVVPSTHSASEKINFKAKVKRGFNRTFGRKESGKIFLQPQSSTSRLLSMIVCSLNRNSRASLLKRETPLKQAYISRSKYRP